MARFIEPFDPRQPLVLAVLESPILLLSDQADVGSVNPAIKPGVSTDSSDLAVPVSC